MVSYVSPFRIKSADLNTLNVQNLNSSLSTYNISTTTTINLSSSQILTILENPLIVIPSPGTGLYYMIDNINMSLNYNSSPYSGDLSFSLIYTNSNLNTNSNIDNISNPIITATESSFGSTYPINGSLSGDTVIQNIVNSSISLIGVGRNDLTGGNSSIKLTIGYTTYQV